MNLIPRKGSPEALPRIANLTITHSATQQEKAERYAESQQQYNSLVEEVVLATKEMEEWRARALAAEAETKRMLEREAELLAKLDLQAEQRLNEREHFNQSLTVMTS